MNTSLQSSKLTPPELLAQERDIRQVAHYRAWLKNNGVTAPPKEKPTDEEEEEDEEETGDDEDDEF